MSRRVVNNVARGDEFAVIARAGANVCHIASEPNVRAVAL